LLRDPFRSVRIEAARVLGRGEGKAFERALSEYVAFLRLSADRPGAWLQRAILQVRRGELRDAKASCKKALELDPSFGPAVVNLADIYRMERRDSEGLQSLQRFKKDYPGQVAVWQAEVLTLVRLKRAKAALALVEKGLRLFPKDRLLLLYSSLLRKK
jgi:tetratricopeptide (TPR) repeat protein